MNVWCTRLIHNDKTGFYYLTVRTFRHEIQGYGHDIKRTLENQIFNNKNIICLLYTSDAADE